MPLIDYKTDLTTLKYGLDRPGGGYSGQPYMQFPIDGPNIEPGIKTYYELNRTSLDFPVRGGLISQLVSGESRVITSTIDRERIQKFFKDAPRGDTFIKKQVGLQLTNPRTQVPNSLTFAGGNIGNAVLPVTNVYNPLNTLAQIQVQGTGAHFNRHGVAPIIYQSEKRTYQYIAGAPENNTEVTNRLSILRALKLIGTTSFLANPALLGGAGIDPTLVDRLGISMVQNQLFNYVGGPGSVYGIGFTRIFRYANTDVTTTSNTNPDPKFTNQGKLAQPYSAIAFTYKQIAEQNASVSRGNTPITQPIQDFREKLPTGTTPRSDYSAFNLNRTFNIGNPGAPNARVRYNDIASAGSENGVDQLNRLSPFYYNADTTDPWTEGGSYTNDLIKFVFECIDNDNPDFSAALFFRAFLDGQISDNSTPEYNSFKYLGRGETFRTYQGFDRTIGFGFNILVQSRQEMRPLYIKLNQLISQAYPDYSQQYNLMRGNVVKLTIGDYIYRMPGFLDSIDVTIDNQSTPWEIALNQFGPNSDDDVRQLPHLIGVRCSFKPITDILPRRVTKFNPFVPLIANKDHYLDPTAATIDDQKKYAFDNPKPIGPQLTNKELVQKAAEAAAEAAALRDSVNVDLNRSNALGYSTPDQFIQGGF